MASSVYKKFCMFGFMTMYLTRWYLTKASETDLDELRLSDFIKTVLSRR